jgi:tetratricopeptide (TPR) repeat protein
VAALLDALGVDHGEFYAGVAGGFHAEVYLARIAGDHDRQKKYADTDLIANGPSRPYTADELREMAAGLRDLRIADPEAARVQALDILRTVYHHDVDPGVESRFEAAIGLAAIYRMRGACGTAATFLLQALHLAGARGWPKARVLHESVPLFADLGDFEAGLQAAELALSEFARLEDFQGQGRVLLSKDNLLGQAGELDAAIEAFQAGLRQLAEGRWFDRFYLLHGLALCFVFKGELAKALRHAEQALSTVKCEDAPPREQANARWLRAEILLRMGRSEGIAELRAVLDFCSSHKAGKLNLALISLRLACACQDHGQIDELGQLTASLLPLLGSVGASNKRLQAAVTEFNSVAIRGELSREIVARTYRKLLKAARRDSPAAAHLPFGSTPPGSPQGIAGSGVG